MRNQGNPEPQVEGEASATLVVNKLRGGLKVAAVKAPVSGGSAA
jgi:chaperonin GroEL (HSP60 family)